MITTNDQNIQSRIFTLRGLQVMLDSDLAQLYGVETKVFNQAVKRNIERFPERFRFQLSEDEFQNLRSQFVTSSEHGGRRYLPYAFTEQGVSMLSAVLNSPTAIDTSIKTIDRFLLIDDEVYHIGASLKDLGKKWFAFSRMDRGSLDILGKLG